MSRIIRERYIIRGGVGVSDVVFRRPFAIPQYYGSFDPSNSATKNTDTFQQALDDCMANGIDLFVPEGTYSMNPASYEATGTGWQTGIKIFGTGGAAAEVGSSRSVLDFSGFSTTGSDVGLTFKNSKTPSRGTTAGDGLYVSDSTGNITKLN